VFDHWSRLLVQGLFPLYGLSGVRQRQSRVSDVRFFSLPYPPPQRLEPHPLNATSTFPFVVNSSYSPLPFPFPPFLFILLAFSDFIKQESGCSVISTLPNRQCS
jgi:hypothetical protein